MESIRRLGEYIDLLILSTAKRLSLPLLTYDKGLMERTKEFNISTAV